MPRLGPDAPIAGLSSYHRGRATTLPAFRACGFGLVFGVWNLGFGFWVLGFGFWCVGVGVWCLAFEAWGLGFGVEG